MVEKVEKKGCIYHIDYGDLTKTQKEVLRLLTDEFLTVKQISIRRQTSLESIYKIIRILRKKGHFGSGLNKVEKSQPTIQPNDIRLHAQEFNLKILFQDNRYQKALKKSNLIFLDSNTIRLYKNSIEVYSGNSFTGKSMQEADKKSLDYFKRLFLRLENDLGITIIKDRNRNLKEINHHYARGDSEIADNYIENKSKIRVFAKEDGKLAFITDDSFGFREDETVHPETAKQDRKAVDKQVNDWRVNNPPTNSELSQIIAETGQGLKILIDTINSDRESTNNLKLVVNKLEQQISSHLSLIKTWEKESKTRRKLYLKELNPVKNKTQSNLNKYFKC